MPEKQKSNISCSVKSQESAKKYLRLQERRRKMLGYRSMQDYFQSGCRQSCIGRTHIGNNFWQLLMSEMD